jgi:holin-like protein
MQMSSAESKAGPVPENQGSTSKIIKVIYAILGVVVLAAFQMVGSAIHHLGFPIPGGVLGLIFLYFGLSTGVIKLKWVEDAAAFLLRHMLLLFIPITVGLKEMMPLLGHQAVAILASLLVSLLAVQITTGLMGHILLRRTDERR